MNATAWLLLCALHGVASMLGWWALEPAPQALTWRSEDWAVRPWALWTTVWLHHNTPHLIANQLALGALTAASWVIRPGRSCTLAWLLSWPLIQLSLPLWPQIGYSIGLAGVLHAGVAVLTVHLLLGLLPVYRARRWGLLLAVCLVGKLLVERGWLYPVVWDDANAMSVVQAAMFSGAAWGALLGLLGAGAGAAFRRRWSRGR